MQAARTRTTQKHSVLSCLSRWRPRARTRRNPSRVASTPIGSRAWRRSLLAAFAQSHRSETWRTNTQCRLVPSPCAICSSSAPARENHSAYACIDAGCHLIASRQPLGSPQPVGSPRPMGLGSTKFVSPLRRRARAGREMALPSPRGRQHHYGPCWPSSAHTWSKFCHDAAQGWPTSEQMLRRGRPTTSRA